MNQNALYIKNRLSLRAPQEQALNILADICQFLPLSKENDIASQVAEIRAKYPVFKDFERQFPNICFALATGVGKTRLMGAFVAYLYKEYHIQDFFILAPNLTIYNKLIDDFSQPSNPKYVFKGISDFAVNPPLVITGDTYREMTEHQLFQESIRINIFNISKINADERSGDKPLIKRLSEYLGQSYFDYLATRERLVILMDESHHYRAKRAMQVINELNPVLGIEVTATPQIQKGSKAVPFRNVVYEYSLARAIKDGFVKKPYVATRKNWKPDNFTPEEIDRLKVQDGIRLHQHTRVELEKYARNNGRKIIKPFVLIVTKDTEHAESIKQMIQGEDFYNGYYKDKVIVVHSAQKGSEKDENIAQLLSLENPLNKVEIVIHVNMLKEGWDVTNLYTIVPLRTSASDTLTEQTIGRGLRLPYGRITNDTAADRLTIVAHDKFQAIIDEANKENSLLRKENIIELDEDFDNTPAKEVVVSNTILSVGREEQNAEQASSFWVPPTPEVKEAVAIFQDTVLPEMGREVQKIGELSEVQVQETAFKRLEEHLTQKGDLFAQQYIAEIKQHSEQLVREFIGATIAIPRVIVQPGKDGYLKFQPFKLDTTNITYQPASQEIFIKSLTDGQFAFLQGKVSGNINQESAENILLAALYDIPEIPYEDYADLLYSLVQSVIYKLKSYLSDEDVKNVLVSFRKPISELIFAQMKQHSVYVQPDYTAAKVYPFERIYPHNYDKITSDKVYHYTDTIEPTSAIPSKVFTGFKKACHNLYKFDSKAEKDFSGILEQDEKVQKWLRPNERQFDIYWRNGSHKYEPDFVVETPENLFLVEIKSARELESAEVEEKSRAAITWITQVNEYAGRTGAKKWKYLLIPHTEVLANRDFAYFTQFAKG